MSNQRKYDELKEAVLRGDFSEQEEKFIPALRLVVAEGKASTALLQRKLRIGYGRAAGLLNHMEDLGLVTVPAGSEPRQVLPKARTYLEKATEWGGAGIGITEDPDHFWTRDKSMFTVVTPHAASMIRLIEHLKTCTDVDYMGKYDLYEDCAHAAADYQEVHDDEQGLLLAVLDAAKPYLAR